MKQAITEILTEFQKGHLSLQEPTDRLLTEKSEQQSRKIKSNQRLKSICEALEEEQNPSKVQDLKNRLSDEFYHGDQA
jgi:hypothetical protein